MRSYRVVRAPDCQCQSRNSPGVQSQHLREADVAILNIVYVELRNTCRMWHCCSDSAGRKIAQTILYNKNSYLGKMAWKQKAGLLHRALTCAWGYFPFCLGPWQRYFGPGVTRFCLPPPHPHPPSPTPLIFPSYRPILIEDIYNLVGWGREMKW